MSFFLLFACGVKWLSCGFELAVVFFSPLQCAREGDRLFGEVHREDMTGRGLCHFATLDSFRASGHHLSQPYNDACSYKSSSPSVPAPHVPATLGLALSPRCTQRELTLAASQEGATGEAYPTGPGPQFPPMCNVPDSTSINVAPQPPMLISDDADNGFRQQEHAHHQTGLAQQPMGLPLLRLPAAHPTPEVRMLQLPARLPQHAPEVQELPLLQLPQQPGLTEQLEVQTQLPLCQQQELQQLRTAAEGLLKLHPPEQHQTRKLCHIDQPNLPGPQLIPVIAQTVVAQTALKSELGFPPTWRVLPKTEETFVLHHEPPGLHHPPPPPLLLPNMPAAASFCELLR